MRKYKIWQKNIIALGMALAVFCAAGPAGARWDELINPRAPYAGPLAYHTEEKAGASPEEPAAQGIYRVERGDTLSGIARKFGLTPSRLATLNKLIDRNRIFAGQVLRLPVSTVTHRVSRGETLSSIALRYGVDIGLMARSNDINNIDRIPAGKVLNIPVGEKVAARAGTGSVLPAERLPWPVTGWVSSPFGARDGRVHEGIDIAADMSEPITAVRGGLVTYAGPQPGYGLTVIIDHGSGLSTLYAHCSKLLVRKGQRVARGQLIARVGSTGRSTGPHLHMEVRLNGVPHDPLQYLVRNYA